VLVDVADLDCIYLSYDEPKKEEYWAKIQNIVPWAKRVDGVKGSDAAHKAAANASDTERFILIDGDNIPYTEFFDLQLDIKQEYENCVFRWKAQNTINGLMYGNGGVSSWTRDFVKNMKTHEATDGTDETVVEFCFDPNYLSMHNVYSTTYPNGSEKHAWRAGFREGVKLALDRGERISKEDFFTKNHYKNLHMLYVWMMVGSDVPNGDWAILGAREGLSMTMLSDWDYIQVRDFEYLNQLWGGRDEMPADVLHNEIFNYGNDLINQLEVPIAIQPFNQEQSEFFKTVYQGPQIR
jgi:hypothetical protein